MRERGEEISGAVVRLLREVRSQTGLTMEELADRAGVHRTYIGLLEQGKRQPTIDVAARIAAALGVPPPACSCRRKTNSPPVRHSQVWRSSRARRGGSSRAITSSPQGVPHCDASPGLMRR